MAFLDGLLYDCNGQGLLSLRVTGHGGLRAVLQTEKKSEINFVIAIFNKDVASPVTCY